MDNLTQPPIEIATTKEAIEKLSENYGIITDLTRRQMEMVSLYMEASAKRLAELSQAKSVPNLTAQQSRLFATLGKHVQQTVEKYLIGFRPASAGVDPPLLSGTKTPTTSGTKTPPPTSATSGKKSAGVDPPLLSGTKTPTTSGTKTPPPTSATSGKK